MKAYTVYQPYAYATVAGLKHYETRPRRTNIRGRVAVHAAKKDAWRSGILEKGIMPEIEALLSEHQGVGNRFAHLDYGAVIGTVEIVDCVPVEEIVNTLSERERVLGDYSPGRFAWVLQNPVMFDEPFPARGQQGWWEWDEIEACRGRIQKATYQLGLNFFNGVTPGCDFPPAEILYSQAVMFMREIKQAHEIEVDPATGDIKLGNVPLDILPLIPAAFEEISDRGTYRVHQYGQIIGTVEYGGKPEPGEPGTVNIGTKTIFRPEAPAQTCEFTLKFNREDGENT